MEMIMETNDKLALIRDYLNVAFPDHRIEDRWDTGRMSHYFRVDVPDGCIRHNILLSHEFVDDNASDLIHDHSREHDFRGKLEEAGKRIVLVTNEGISVAEDS